MELILFIILIDDGNFLYRIMNPCMTELQLEVEEDGTWKNDITIIVVTAVQNFVQHYKY